MPFSIFEYLDPALVEQEKRTEKAVQAPSVWPSEASAVRTDPTVGAIVGKCHRAVQFRMRGTPITDKIDAVGAWRWTTGRMIEGQLAELARRSKPNIFVASGVRHYVPDLRMSLELDLVVLDPDTKRGWIGECKTYYGPYAKREIVVNSHPKLENIIQDCLYLLEFPTGVKLKAAIRKGLENKPGNPRNRIEANLEMLEQMDDGPVGTKLVYVSRDDCTRTEFDITIVEDFDGHHYPAVNGQLWKEFTIESIYQRFRLIKEYWYRDRREGVRLLKEDGIEPPPGLKLVLGDDDQPEDWSQLPQEARDSYLGYLEKLEAKVRKLPREFLAPAEYEWAYSPDKIEYLHQQKLIAEEKYQQWTGKTKTGRVKKRRINRIGDWQCLLPETPIEMASGGIVPIDRVDKGMKTRLGPVEGAMFKKVDREVVEIHPFNLLPLRLTYDHEVKVSSGRFVGAADLLPMEARKLHSYQRFNYGDEMVVQFDTAQVSTGLEEEELAGIGLWLAEGYYRREDENIPGKHFGIGYTIHPDEDELADMIHLFAARFPHRRTGYPATVTDRVKTDSRTGNKYRVLNINSVASAKFMKKWTAGTSSHSKALSPKLRRALLSEQAILINWMKAGDGCTTRMRSSQMHVYTSVSLQLANDVQRMQWRQGKVAGIVRQEESGGFAPEGSKAYHVRWYDGKSYSSRIHNGIFFTKIDRVERNVSYNGLVYDLTIGSSHEIPTISGVVHNCLYCPYKQICVPIQNPEWTYQVYDDALVKAEEEAELGEGELVV